MLYPRPVIINIQNKLFEKLMDCCCFRFLITTNFQRIHWTTTKNSCSVNCDDHAVYIKIYYIFITYVII